MEKAALNTNMKKKENEKEGSMPKIKAPDVVSHSGLTPVTTEESIEESESSHNDSEEAFDQGSYKDEAYWSLPENVRHAIDLTKRKNQHSDFYTRLTSLNDKIGVYQKCFYTKTPKFEQTYIQRKRQRLEQLMQKEQEELQRIIAEEQERKSPNKMANQTDENAIKLSRTKAITGNQLALSNSKDKLGLKQTEFQQPSDSKEATADNSQAKEEQQPKRSQR